LASHQIEGCYFCIVSYFWLSM